MPPRVQGPLRRALLASLLAATAASSAAPDPFARRLPAQCAVSCAAVPDRALARCGPRVPYPACMTGPSWEQMEAPLPRVLERLGLDLEAVLRAAAGGDACAAAVANLHCRHLFPACELGTEVRPLCADACAGVLAACRGSPEFALPSTLCEDMPDLASDARCVGLEYEGANHVLWIAGFSIGLVFSITATLGMNLQKLSMNREALQPRAARRPPFKQPIWALGIFIIAAGTLTDFAAFGMAPQSLLAPLGALSLVWNLLLAPLFNGETLTRQTLAATCVICLGTLLTVIFAAHSTPTYTLDDLVGLYRQPVMIVYIVFVVAFLVTVAARLKRIEDALSDDEEEEEEDAALEDRALVPGVETGIEIGLPVAPVAPASPASPAAPVAPAAPAPPPHCEQRKNTTYLPAPRAVAQERAQGASEMSRIVCYGGLAGCFGGQSVLLAKSTAELVKNLLAGSERGAFYHPQPYLIVLCMAVCLLSQITILNAGLSRFSALLMVPVYQSFWILFSVLGGIIYFREYRALHVVQTVFFIGGILTTLAGVFLLLRERVDGSEALEPECEKSGAAESLDDTRSVGTCSEDDGPEEGSPNEERDPGWLNEKPLIDAAEKKARTTNL